jgi:hypothetical protein
MVRRLAAPPSQNRTREYVVDIFDEVDEELRAERAQALLKRYAGLIIAVALLIVGAAGGWQAWRWWQAKQDMAAAQSYLAAMSMADRANLDAAQRQAAISAFGGIVATAPDGYRTLARLRAAALRADSGDIAGAVALWNDVATDPNTDPLLRDLANLLSAEHQIDTGDPGLLEARLKALAEPGNPWRALAQEQLAVLDLRQGKTDAAKAELTKLAQDVTAPAGVRGRAAGLLARLGG